MLRRGCYGNAIVADFPPQVCPHSFRADHKRLVFQDKAKTFLIFLGEVLATIENIR